MRIIKEGQLPAKKLHQATCLKCGCKVEFEQGEARYHEGYGNRDSGYWSVQCPTTGCSGSISSAVSVSDYSTGTWQDR